LEEFLAKSENDENVTYLDISSSTATNNFHEISNFLDDQPLANQEAPNSKVHQQDLILSEEEVFNRYFQDMNFTPNHEEISDISFGNTTGENLIQFTINALPVELSTESGNKKPRKTNAERCKHYRSMQKTKKLNLENELNHESKRNILLKHKADSLEKTVKKMKAFILKKYSC